MNNKSLYWMVIINLIVSVVTLILLYQIARVKVNLTNSSADNGGSAYVMSGAQNLKPGQTYSVIFSMDSSGSLVGRLVDDSSTQKR